MGKVIVISIPKFLWRLKSRSIDLDKEEVNAVDTRQKKSNIWVTVIKHF